MKTKTLVAKLYRAILDGDTQTEKTVYLKLIKKSLKHKKTHVVR